MSKAHIIVGLGFGDEGKGTMTDFLCRHHDAKLVVRYNGGSQAGHNVVTSDDKHHTFSQIGSASPQKSSNSSTVNISIEPVAESISFNTIATINSLEDSAVSLPLASYFNSANFETGSGVRGDEKISIEIKLPSTIALQKIVGGVATVLTPVATGNSLSTYVVSTSQANLNTELSGYQLLPSTNYHSESLLGSNITIKATPYEPSNGATGSSVSTTVNLVVAPVADTPNAPFVVRSAVTINESQANTPDWYLLGDAITLADSYSHLEA
jgi:hypothetical protein